MSVNGNLSFFHHLKQGSLCFGRGAVDLIYQHDIAEDGAFIELERGLFRIKDRCTKHIAWHQVGCELDA
jgi:hypothetical protein